MIDRYEQTGKIYRIRFASGLISIKYKNEDGTISNHKLLIESAYFKRKENEYIIKARYDGRQECKNWKNSQIISAFEILTGNPISDVWEWLEQEAVAYELQYPDTDPSDVTTDRQSVSDKFCEPDRSPWDVRRSKMQCTTAFSRLAAPHYRPAAAYMPPNLSSKKRTSVRTRALCTIGWVALIWIVAKLF